VGALPDGALAYVGNPAGGVGQSQGSAWQLVTQLAALPALSAHVVIASTAAGRVWQRQVNIINQRWVQSTTWFLDGAAGDDQNDGQTNVTALQTGAELARRMARQQVGNGGTVVVSVLSNITDTLDFSGVMGTVAVAATEPTQGGVGATGTLTASVAINHAANTFQQITAAGVDFAPFIATKSKIVLTSGALTGAWAWFESGAGGVGVAAQTSAFVTQATPLSIPVVVTPAGNETYKIVSQLTCVAIASSEANSPATTLALLMSVSGLRPTAQASANHGGVIFFNGCDLSTTFFQCRGPNTVLNACKVASSSVSGGGTGMTHNASLITGSTVGAYGSQILMSLDTLISNGTIFTNDGEFRFTGSVGWNNTTAPKHAVDMTGTPSMGQIIFNAGIAIYGVLAGAGSIGFNLGKYAQVDAAGVVPTMTTTGANVAFGSANKTWAQLPFVDQFDVGAGPVAGANMAGWL
jgi:hypothetical protein